MLDLPGWSGHRAGQNVDIRLTAEDGYHHRPGSIKTERFGPTGA